MSDLQALEYVHCIWLCKQTFKQNEKLIWLTRVTSLLSQIKNLVTLKSLTITQHNVCFLYVNGLKQSFVHCMAKGEQELIKAALKNFCSAAQEKQ